MARRHLLGCFLILILLALLPGAVLAFSIDKEIKLGQEASQEVEKEMPLSKNAKWQQEISDMGKRFVPFVTRKDIPYHFRVVQSKNELNAFALPGGYIYFTERMWRIMTPDERAAIMAHEITHCDRRHGVDMMIKSQQRMLWMLPLIIATGGGAAGEVLMVGNMAINQRYSRKMEREADELGIKLLKSAGFNPAGSVTSMKKLLHVESSINRYEISGIFASHPDTAKRITYLAEEAEALGADPSELDLKAVDDPSRLGNVTRTVTDIGLLYARTSKPVKHGQKIAIKKVLWDDDLNALAPRTVAVATVLTPGTQPVLLLDKSDDYGPEDVWVGDGIYPMAKPQPTASDTSAPAP